MEEQTIKSIGKRKPAFLFCLNSYVEIYIYILQPSQNYYKPYKKIERNNKLILINEQAPAAKQAKKRERENPNLFFTFCFRLYDLII